MSVAWGRALHINFMHRHGTVDTVDMSIPDIPFRFFFSLERFYDYPTVALTPPSSP